MTRQRQLRRATITPHPGAPTSPPPPLETLLAWMATAKESLPAMNNAIVPADQITEMSALIDRMHGVALGLRRQAAEVVLSVAA